MQAEEAMVNNVDVVIGASGGCGKLCVEHLLKNGGLVRAVGRVRVAMCPSHHPPPHPLPQPDLNTPFRVLCLVGGEHHPVLAPTCDTLLISGETS